MNRTHGEHVGMKFLHNPAWWTWTDRRIPRSTYTLRGVKMTSHISSLWQIHHVRDKPFFFAQQAALGRFHLQPESSCYSMSLELNMFSTSKWNVPYSWSSLASLLSRAAWSSASFTSPASAAVWDMLFTRSVSSVFAPSSSAASFSYSCKEISGLNKALEGTEQKHLKHLWFRLSSVIFN